MIKIFKKTILLLAIPLISLAHGQDIPAVTGPVSLEGFHIPDVPGTLHYSVSGTQTARTGFYSDGSLDWSTALSADIGFLSVSERRPFNVLYSGGYIHNTEGQPNSTFQDLSLTQSFLSRSSSLVFSDTINYLPEAPSGGLSGIPGLGDLGTGPIQTDPGTGSEILSRYGQRIANTAIVSASRNLTGSTSLEGSGSFYLQRFLDRSDGLDNDNISGNGDVKHRIDALSSASATYSYSHFSYPGNGFSFDTQSISVGYIRQWNRHINSDVSIGPQRTSTPPTGGIGGSVLNYTANANVGYTGEFIDYTLRYTHGVSGGSGVLPGTTIDSLNFVVDRRFGRLLHANATAGYTSHSTLSIISPVPDTLRTFILNAEVSREISENISAYISYSVQKQDNENAAASVDGFDGVTQIVAFGITYSPRTLHFGHQ